MTPFDPRAWLVWLFASGLMAILTGNPLYLVLLLFISRIVETACAPLETKSWRLPFWRISLVILLFSTIFNMLMAHVGQTELFALPPNWALVGGSITLEAAVFGFLNGLRLVTLLSFFLAFNTIVSVHQLAGLTPQALHELGLVMLIAITYVPETMRQFKRIRDAQAIRGHKFEGLRAWRPVLIPLLVAGLERALNLSETMVARGYGSTTSIAMPPRARVLLLVGLVLTLGGALRLAWGAMDGWLLLSTGGLAVALAYRDLNRLVTRTHYRPRRWSSDDTFMVLGTLFSLSLLLPFTGIGRSLLGYSPYPQISPPPFNVWVGLSFFGLAVPAVVATMRAPRLEATS